MINSRQKVVEFNFHISYSATVNDEHGIRFFIEEEKKKKRLKNPSWIGWIRNILIPGIKTNKNLV